ncbi:MAG TPA: D-aminoacyl-tRNA deacylase [Bdellovibrionota bacterium]|nr:D-aminoacyl-tRNA deacylase [Bdellovibrionota bacterium]
MRAVIQRVKQAQVTVDGQQISRIDSGILTLLGVEAGDTEDELKKILTKICELRIFDDAEGKMNLSLQDVKGQHLIVSQFTLAGDCTQGRRPGFARAEKPGRARLLYERALELSREMGVPTQGGKFQAMMDVSLINDGPVTFVLDYAPATLAEAPLQRPGGRGPA